MEAKNLIEYVIQNCEVNKAALNEMINLLPEEIRLRFVEGILHIVHPEDLVMDIPKVKDMPRHKKCRFKSYNYLYDLVTYEYDEEETRWFSDQESAVAFSEFGSKGWCGVDEPKDGFEFGASHVFTYNGECPLKSWMEAK